MAWIGGYAEWTDEATRTAFLSIAFSWHADHAAMRARSYRGLGYKVKCGGPGLFILKRKGALHEIFLLAEYGADYPDAIARHNPDATIASRGCPGMGTEESPKPCSFCIVPPMEGTTFKLLPDFPVRPILCDNNLSALPSEYQDYIIRRYHEAGVPLKDANSGFEPQTFTPDVYARWRPLVNAGKGPWRFGYDTLAERKEALRVMAMLKDEPAKRKRPYVLIGNEPKADCVARLRETIAAGCEPYCQAEIKLHAKEKRYFVKYDWTYPELIRVRRWIQSFAYRTCDIDEFDPALEGKEEREDYDPQQGLFV